MQNNDEVVILDLIRKLASKKAVKFTLKECLNDLTKERINKFATNYKVANRSKMKKDELVEAICNEMIQLKAATETIQNLSETSLDLLNKISAEEKAIVTNELLQGLEELMNLALVFTYIEDGNLVAVVPNEFKTSENKTLNVSSKISEEKYNEVVKYIVGFAEAYGMYEPQILIDTFNSQNDEQLLEEELIEVVNAYKNQTSRVRIKNGYIIQDSLLMIENGVEHLEKLREGKIYHRLTKEDVQKYANGIYIEMTDAHHNLRNKLVEVCHNDVKVGNEIFEDICDSLVFSDLNTHFIISEFTRRKLQVNTIKEFEMILTLAKKVNANTRKWGNKGFTQNELELLASKKIVGRNEPCICGSGKKYKKCCGR